MASSSLKPEASDVPFDLSSAQPVANQTFDLSTATPVNSDVSPSPLSVVAAAPVPTQDTSFAGWLKSNAGVPLARAGINAVTALPLMAQDFGVAVRNVGSDVADNGIGPAVSKLIHGGQYPYELPSHVVQQAMQPYLPAPTTTPGKLSELANTILMGGAASSAGVPGMTAPTYGNAPPGFVSSNAPSGGLTPAQERAADAGQDLGMRLTPGQQTGSKVLQQVEARLQAVPSTSGPFNRLAAGNQRALNSAWAGPSGGIGQGGALVDSTVLSRAADRTGEIFDTARNANSIIAQDPAVTSKVLNGIDSDFEGLIPGSVRDNPLVARLESLTGQGAINGEQLGNLSSKLGRAANNQMTSPAGDRELGQALYAVKDHADDLLQSTLSGEDAATYAAARQQYRALMQLTARTGNVNPSTGNVGGTSIADYLQAKDKGGFTFGRNQSDAYNAARFAQAFKPIVGDSGTATRSAGLTQMLLALPGNALSWAYLRPAAPLVRGLAQTPGAVTNAFTSGASSPALSGITTGLASLAGSPVPYLTQ